MKKKHKTNFFNDFQEKQRLKCNSLRSRNSILPLNPPIGTKLIKGGTPGKMLFLNAP